jgi:uncharacterized RDD family membrane protein YckC
MSCQGGFSTLAQQPGAWTEPMTNLTIEPCGLGRRFLVMIYDGVIILAILMAAAALALLFGQEKGMALQDPLYTGYLLIFWFFYLAWCWRNGGMTLGMRAWKVRLASETTEKPGWRQCLMRFIIGFVSVAALGMGFFWALFNRKKRTWHDLVSRTRLDRIR